ncbi:MAG: hypothetical protein ACLT98_08690 [Eggerthellaceae bacterium]
MRAARQGKKRPRDHHGRLHNPRAHAHEARLTGDERQRFRRASHVETNPSAAREGGFAVRLQAAHLVERRLHDSAAGGLVARHALRPVYACNAS